ncbi:MAG TPA: hypothetical protein PLD23_14205 [Armatimonadota bacterium]|nr:hypothetical protein [Armatimonadota bacterium]
MRSLISCLVALWIAGITVWFLAQPYVGQACSREAGAAGTVVRLLSGGD